MITAPVIQGERWLPISGYEGLYEISDHGRVRRITKQRSAKLLHEPRYLDIAPNRLGYKSVALWKNARGKRMFVHRLVLSHFVGEPAAGMQCCHNDGNPANNHVMNLRWGTGKDNMDDSKRHGTFHPPKRRGIANPMARFTESEIRQIRAEPEFYGVIAMLARAYGARPSCIFNIRARKTYADVEQLL